MTLYELIFVCIVGLAVLCLVLFPSFRQKLKVLMGGFLNVFIEDKAKTPEGARAIYQQAIEEAEGVYNKVTDTLRSVSGRYNLEHKNLNKLNEELARTEAACENFVKAGQMDEAKLYAEKRQELVDEIARKKILVSELLKAKEEATEIAQHSEEKLRKLKAQSKSIVSDMQIKQQLSEVYDDIDELKKVKTTDKLLDSVRDGYEELSMKAAGAKEIHEAKVSTKIKKAENKAKTLSSDAYLQELIAKQQPKK